MTTDDPRIDEILNFWFGQGKGTAEICAEKKSLWWSKDEQVDSQIRNRFADITAGVHNGDLAHWQRDARGMLASIVALDQFPRNMYRGDRRSFDCDARARELVNTALDQELDQELLPVQRVFVYMPLEHSESLVDQDRCVELFERMLDDAADDERAFFEDWLDFARRHRDIISEFARFPHRNEILGRESTEEENLFLTRPGSSF